MTVLDKPVSTETPTPPKLPSTRGRSNHFLVAGGVLVFIGILWLMERLGVIDMTVTAVLALATMIVGVSLMILSLRAPHRGLVVFGVVLGLVTFASAAAPLEGFQGGVGNRTIVVGSVDDILPDYNVAVGNLTLDLTSIGAIDQQAALSASVGVGDLVVRVPADITIEVRANAGAGQVEIFGQVEDAVGVTQVYHTPGVDSDSAQLVLDLSVFVGHVEVTNG